MASLQQRGLDRSSVSDDVTAESDTQVPWPCGFTCCKTLFPETQIKALELIQLSYYMILEFI